MISKNKIKLLKSLQIKKYRQKYNKAILEGKRLIEESMTGGANIQEIWCTNEFLNNTNNHNFINKIKKLNLPLDRIEQDDLALISSTENSQGVFAEININYYENNSLLNLNDHLIILNSISDPGNLGTILRTAAWYGIKSIIMTENTIDPYNLKCLRSGVGAQFFFNKLVMANNDDIISFLKNKNYTIYCADLKGTEISQIETSKKWALILGSEAHGLDTDFDNFDKITINQIGTIESLNVAVACGIILNKLLS